jgi:multidrug/hemolysin transport system permease protein
MYILFLGKMQSDFLADDFGLGEEKDWMVASWIMAGILMVSTVTVPLGAVGKLIDDRDKGMLNDFYAAPINRNILALSYLISAWVIGFVMVMANFVIGQIYVLSQGGEFMGVLQLLQTLGLVILSIMTFSSIFFYLSLFIRSSNAYGTLSTLVGTFIGFLGGIYIPIGVLGENVQRVMNLLPTAHAVTIMRRVYMSNAVESAFGDLPDQAYETYAYWYGMDISIGSFSMQSWQMVLSLVITMLVFYSLSVLRLRNSKL